MSVQQLTDVWESEVEGAMQQVLLVLANAANDEGENVYPSQIYVAWRTGLELITVKMIFRKLREKGALVLVRRGSRRPGERHTNEYRLNLERLPIKKSLVEWCKERGIEPSEWMLHHEAKRVSRRAARRKESGISDIPDSSEQGIREVEPGISDSRESGISNIPNTKGGEAKATQSEGGARSSTGAPRRAGGTPLPPDFALTAEMREWARVNLPALRREQIERETLIFVGKMRSTQKTSFDWLSEWQAWVARKAGWMEEKPASPTDQQSLPLDTSTPRKPDPNCKKCFGTGQEVVKGKTGTGARRCECRTRPESDEEGG